MDISTAFPSKFIKSDDLGGKAVPLFIDRVEMQEVGTPDDKETKPILYFVNRTKGLVLNKTNAADIAEQYGNDTDKWTNQSIVLFATKVEFKGRRVMGLRVRFKDGAPAALQDNEEPPPPTDDDDLPF